MKILSITAQKPNSTGSGVYMTELVKGFEHLGCRQAVIAGIYKDDVVSIPEAVWFYPVFYQSSELPFPIPGMSDEMPYESMLYSSMTNEMLVQLKTIFLNKVSEVLSDFKPELIICHHLYFVTAAVRERFPECNIVGICHGTDLRQLKKTSMEREYIKGNIRKLNRIFVLHERQKSEITENLNVEQDKICIIGSGFNSKIFFNMHFQKNKRCTQLIFAGKLSEKKGIISLIRSMEYLYEKDIPVILKLAGGYGNEKEYDRIAVMARRCSYPVEFLGKVNQNKLAEELNKSDIFVLPSFYEGLPLVLLEALACGTKVVSADLPGVQKWMNDNIPNNGISYVPLPTMKNIDEPEQSELAGFEKNLADVIEKVIALKTNQNLEFSHLSWEGLCKKIMNHLSY